MADDKTTTATVGGHKVVFSKGVKAGDRVTAKDIKSIDGAAPGETLPLAVTNFIAGIAGKAS